MTTPNARDRGLEALLRRQGHGAGPSEGCPDAETLAAWADGGLDETSRAAAEAHTAGCTRCQALLASIVRSEPVPVPAAAPSLWDRLGFRWLVPLTAAVGAVLVWIAVPSPPRPRVADTAAVSQAPAPVAPAEHDEPAAPPARDAIRQASPTNPPVPVAEPPVTPAAAGARGRAADTAPPASNAATPTTAAAAVAGKARTDVAVGQESKLEAPARSDARRQMAAQAATSAPSAVNETVSREERVAAESPAAPEAGAPPAASPAFGGATVTEQAPGARESALADRGSPLIVSADSLVRWRLAGVGVVERSADGGASWQQLPIGVETEMLAGAAPSASVCWLVGRGGVVLLTVDARAWRRIPFPASADLVDVQALNGRVATVRTSDGAVLRTTNGGTNWTRVP